MKNYTSLGLLAITSSIAVSCSFSGLNKKTADKPNILFLFADDMCYDAFNAAGNGIVKTPNLDRLAQSGMRFSHCYNQGSWTPAVCLASRAMLITGKYLYHAQAEIDTSRLWAEVFSDAGYATFLTGKWHNKDHTALRSFDQIKSMAHGMYETAGGPEGNGYRRPTPDNNSWSPSDKTLKGHWSPQVNDLSVEDGEKKMGKMYTVNKHTSELFADLSIEYLENYPAESRQPFFMYVAFNAPHDPRQSPKEYVDMYSPGEIPLPVNFLPEHPFDQGQKFTLRDEILAPFPRTPEAVKVHLQEYYAIITHLDDQIGRILDALERTGKLKNTYIIFSADNGLAIGRHGLMGKQNQYEHSIRMPLIISGPGIPAGKVSDALVYLQDIYPTSCELAGVDIPSTVEFNSLVPVIEGKINNGHDAIFGAYLDYQRMIRNKDYKLILYPEAGQVQLFDMNADPDEMNNLANRPEYSETLSELFRELHNLQMKVGDQLDLSVMGIK